MVIKIGPNRCQSGVDETENVVSGSGHAVTHGRTGVFLRPIAGLVQNFGRCASCGVFQSLNH